MDMTMTSAVPDWLTPVAWTYITVSLISAAIIASDIYLRRRRHFGVATELVWITSALYLGPVRRCGLSAPGAHQPHLRSDGPSPGWRCGP